MTENLTTEVRKKTASEIAEKRIAMMTLFFMCSVIFLLLVSWSTSVFYKYLGYDTTVFKALGVFADNGLIPYKDFFDHKGPIVVFIEYIGYGLTRSDYSLLLLQSVFLAVSISGAYKIARVFLDMNKSIGVAIASLPICSLFMAGQGGNTVEEWILPFLVWSTYFAMYFFVKGEGKHKPVYSLVYGLTVAFAAFSRLTNAMPVIIIIIFLLVYAIKKKHWASIWKNALFFVIGVLIITIPIFVWFIAKGAFGDMMYATFVFNFKYMQSKVFVSSAAAILKHTGRYLLPFIVAAFISVIMIMDKQHVWINRILLTQSIVAVVLELTGALFAHYLIIWIPTIITTLVVLLKEYKTMKFFTKGYIFVLIVVCIGTNIIAFERYHDYYKEQMEEYDIRIEDVEEIIPNGEKNVISVDNNPYVYMYLEKNPCYKYFHLQDSFSSYDKNVAKEWHKLARETKAEYVILNGMRDYSSNKIFKKHYRVRFRNDRFTVLKLRDGE